MSSDTVHIDLVSIPPNGYLEGIYSIINPQIGTTRSGKPYLKCLLRDATGEVPARQWTFEENALGVIASTGFVRIAGHTQVYNGQVQLILEQIAAADISLEQMRRLLPTTEHDIDEMFAELSGTMRSLEHPAMRALAEAYLADEAMMASFRQAPAAMSLHHAWIGGLLEHTLQLIKLAELMLPRYPQLNRDLVLMGLFLHDLGKTQELSWDKGFEYTPDGNLIGHVVRGAIWLQFKAAAAARQSGERLPSDALRVLQHIVLSHHGTPEFGAAKHPSTPEAIFVALLDNLDAKTSMALSCVRRDAPDATQMGDFTDRVWALSTRLYTPDPLREAPADAPRPESSEPKQTREEKPKAPPEQAERGDEAKLFKG